MLRITSYHVLQHIGSGLRRTLNAFVGTALDPVPDAAVYLSDLSGFLYRFKNILILVQFITLDVLIVCFNIFFHEICNVSYLAQVYRCYMIWDKKILVALVPSCGIVVFLGMYSQYASMCW